MEMIYELKEISTTCKQRSCWLSYTSCVFLLFYVWWEKRWIHLWRAEKMKGKGSASNRAIGRYGKKFYIYWQIESILPTDIQCDMQDCIPPPISSWQGTLKTPRGVLSFWGSVQLLFSLWLSCLEANGAPTLLTEHFLLHAVGPSFSRFPQMGLKKSLFYPTTITIGEDFGHSIYILFSKEGDTEDHSS